MTQEFKLCEGCPTDPPCANCPSRPKLPMRVGLPPVIGPRVKKERPPLDREKMGYGKHEWEYIDPKAQPTDFGPPDGVPRRDFNNAFNCPHPDTTVTLDHMSRYDARITTNSPGFEGEWLVREMPQYKEGCLWAFMSRPDSLDIERVPMVSLGCVADRISNLFRDDIVTKLVSGGRATRDNREALTKKNDVSYKAEPQ